MIKKYRKKPVVIEAMHFESNNQAGNLNMNEICIWINGGIDDLGRHAWHNGTDIFIQTLEGDHKAECGDYIIKGVKGEFYPCKPDIFEMTYEFVN